MAAIRSQPVSQRVFVTGATGVLGRRAVPLLVRAGHFVTAVVRSERKANLVRAAGATPVSVDLFDAAAVRSAINGHDAVAHLATNIPTGPAAAERSAWRTNDSLRRDVAAVIASAAADAGVARMIQESITFPYVDRGDRWIDEQCERTYFWGNETTVAAEAAAARVTAAGGAGVVLRFAMFMAPDSAHCQSFVRAAQRGSFGIVGAPAAFISFIHVDDAAQAVVAALDAPAGIYNVAEPEPRRRSDHREALASVVGQPELRLISELVNPGDNQALQSLARSHRISSQPLRDALGWQPARHAIESWKEVAELP
jgi:nucleoside-diphosphate-sugar epimerase